MPVKPERGSQNWSKLLIRELRHRIHD